MRFAARSNAFTKESDDTTTIDNKKRYMIFGMTFPSNETGYIAVKLSIYFRLLSLRGVVHFGKIVFTNVLLTVSTRL